MNEIRVPETLTVSPLKHLVRSLDSGITSNPQEIGSEVAYCPRKVVIEKLNGHNRLRSPQMVRGEIWETILSKPDVLRAIIEDLNSQLGLHPKKITILYWKEEYNELIPDEKRIWPFDPEHQIVIVQLERNIPIGNGRSIRMHIDTYTSYYILEWKTTEMYFVEFTGHNLETYLKVVPYQVAQVNTYMYHQQLSLGFLYILNWGLWKSNKQGHDWDVYSKDYEKFIPIKFDPKLARGTKERANFLFDCIESKTIPKLESEFYWECNHCEEPTREECGKEAFQCVQTWETKSGKKGRCGNKNWDWSNRLTEEFKATPYCERHFNELYPRHKYEKYRYLNYKDLEVIQ